MSPSKTYVECANFMGEMKHFGCIINLSLGVVIVLFIWCSIFVVIIYVEYNVFIVYNLSFLS